MSRPRSITSPPQIIASDPEGTQHAANLEEGRTIHSPQSHRHSEPDHNARSPTKGDSLDIFSRRIRRTQTSRSYRPKLAGRQWKPGQEPGIDPAGPMPGTAPVGLKEVCQITVVDYSQEEIEIRELDNDQLGPFLDEGRDESLTCRWINVNVLSWDVISMLAREKKFHPLAIEDMLNRRNRTKADWYSDHTFIVLPLQRLVHVHDEKCDHDEESETDAKPSMNGIISWERDPSEKKKSWAYRVKRAFGGGGRKEVPTQTILPSSNPGVSTTGTQANDKPNGLGDPQAVPSPLTTRTLQRYNGGPNLERTEYMEMHSALRVKGLAVGVEQVSIFLSADNTVVSFFEASADDIEAPIINRLSSRETVLRRTADASMLVQAILDAIIDMAIPVTAAYKDAMDELELNVVTEPAIKYTKSLYILISEVVAFRANINPVANLINAIRDHKGGAGADSAARPGRNMQSDSGIKINPTAYTYLGDVEDHILLITDNLDQMRRSADNMIDLIFNTISAYQNESMRQLTTVTIVFLPLSFLTGYFGMNFKGPFPALEYGDYYFWWIAAPVAVFVTLLLMRDGIGRWLLKTKQRRHIALTRKKRRDNAEEEKEKRM